MYVVLFPSFEPLPDSRGSLDSTGAEPYKGDVYIEGMFPLGEVEIHD
jgi:hypothetical protein